MTPLEAFYGRNCRSLVGWHEVGEFALLGSDLVNESLENVLVIRDRLKTTQSLQKYYANKTKRDLELK